MTAAQIIDAVESAGGRLWLEGGSYRYRIPREAGHFLPDLRARRDEVCRLLAEREHAVFMPVPCTCSEKAYPHFRHRDGSGPGSRRSLDANRSEVLKRRNV